MRYLLIPICLYYLYFKNEKILEYLFLIIFLLVIFVTIDSLFQFFSYTAANGFGSDLLGFKSNWYGRLTGPFGDELIPGSYISKFGLIGYIYILINKKIKQITLIHCFYLSSILLVCFLSGERMAFAIFLLSLSVLFFFLKNYKIKILISIFFGFILIFAIFKLHPFYNDYKVLESTEYHQGLKIEKKIECPNNKEIICSKIINIQPSFFKILQNFSSSAYGEIYILSYEMFKNNPITGIGLSNFKSLCENQEKYNKLMVHYNCASHPHNTYMQWLSEGGLLTLSFFILYLVVLVNFIIKNKGDNNSKILALILILILFWPIMSTGSVIKNWYGVTVFFIIGISTCISRIKIND